MARSTRKDEDTPSARQEAGLVEDDYEPQVPETEPLDEETLAQMEAATAETGASMAYMSEEDMKLEMQATVVGPPGYGSPDPATNLGKLVPLEGHPLRSDALPEGHPAAISEEYAAGYTDVTTMPGEPSTPIGPSDLDTDLMGTAEDAASGDVNATQGAVDLAESEGVDLSQVEGTGENGRITKADVETYVAANPAS
jgi:pyruvate/2-oxoglutarate dehydrogenase complex dihydrolipoamide acyltransferase (E2) component